ncbi:MAG: nucleotidyltransferase domain-containing protein [Candidatus Acidiferrum sp.]
MSELAERRTRTADRIVELRARLKRAASLASGKACVFATGSFGRQEAGPHSDLDLFILGKRDGNPGTGGIEGSRLKRLDEICIKADLIEATRELNIQEFSGDGRYLTHYSVHEFTKTLGTPEDDVTNTFTARLLLLLESCPLLEPGVYLEVTKEVVAAYWRDYEDHKGNFIPAFLGNDILRLWRTFCVNYEARTARVPDEEKAKGKLKNYKLKHSRLLTCYSALLYLLAVYGDKQTVSESDAMSMIGLTPTERLEWLMDRPSIGNARSMIEKLLQQYERFLETTNAPEGDLVSRFKDKKAGQSYMIAAYDFGDLMFETLTSIGGGSRFHRLLVV